MAECVEKNVGEVLQLASTTELIEILKCPVCKELPIPPIYSKAKKFRPPSENNLQKCVPFLYGWTDLLQILICCISIIWEPNDCVVGHTVCSFCFPKLKKCTLCNGKLLRESRAFMLESLIGASFVKCKYSRMGCAQIQTGSTYRDHLLSCDFRPVDCHETAMGSCKGFKIPYLDYVKHLQVFHHIEGYDDDHEYYEKTECIPVLHSSMSLPLFYITYDEKIFLKHVRIENSSIHWWISLVGPQCEAEQYGATIIVYRKDLEKMKVEFKVPVHGFRKTFEEISIRSECASMAIDQLPPYCLMDSTFLSDNERVEYLWEMKYAIWDMC